MKPNNEFVSADVVTFKDPGTYEMLGRARDDSKAQEGLSNSTVVSPVSPPTAKSGRETPDYFGREARYTSPSRSFSAPKGPGQNSMWNTNLNATKPQQLASPKYYGGLDPLSMNKI